MTDLRNHSDVKALVDGVLPNILPSERLVTRGISWLETTNSLGWGTDPALGAGSNNMGAVTDPSYHAVPADQEPTPPNANQFLHVDSRPDPKSPSGVFTYVTAFKKYPTPADGFVDVAMVALKPNVRAAIATGSVWNVSKAMHDNVYYTGVLPTAKQNIDAHAKRLYDSMLLISKATGEPFPFVLGAAPVPSSPSAPQPQQPTSSGQPSDLPVLRLGSKGSAVELWQRFLKVAGFRVIVTSVFDNTTKDATMQFQTRQKITIDGVVGPQSWGRVLT